MAERIVFTGKGKVSLDHFEPDRVCGRTVLFATEYSLMSTGTENIVLNRDFSSGTTWDAWVRYPFYPGYCCVGTIAEAGDLLPVPDGVDPRDAVWFALAKIASMGARAARYHLGDSVCVIGAGPVGQMSVRWAFAGGAGAIVVCDPAPARLDMAQRGGATAVIARPVSEAKQDLVRSCGGTLPRVVIDTTGHAAVFASALSLCADRGTVVLLGDTGHPEAQHLTSDVVSRGVTIVGAHDTHTDAQWDEPAIARLFFGLVSSGRFRMDGLNTHTFVPEQCVQAYATANGARGQTMGILFDWRRAGPGGTEGTHPA